MNTERQISRRPRRGHHHHEHTTMRQEREAFMAGRGIGHRARSHWESESDEGQAEITRRPRCGGHRDHARSHSEASHHGAHAGRYARDSWKEARGEHRHAGRKHGKGHLHRTIAEMRERIDEMERRIAQLQGSERIVERETSREIIRSRREHGSGSNRRCHKAGGRMHGQGRRMGRMMHRAAASQLDREAHHPDA